MSDDGSLLLELDGSIKLDADGSVLLYESGLNTCRCACGEAPVYVCGTDNTCNEYCNQSIKAFSRGPDCVCPCPARRAYPRCVKLSWTVTVLGVYIPVSGTARPGFQPDPSHPDRTFDTTACPTTVTVESLVLGGGCYLTDGGFQLTQVLHAPEEPDVTYGDFPNENIFVLLGYELSPCGSQIKYKASLNLGGGGYPSTDLGVLAEVDSGWVSRCEKGSVGTLIWEPACTDCSDNPCVADGGPASICAHPLTVDINVWNGTEYEMRSVPIGGGIEDGASATIDSRTDEDGDEKCCPGRNPTNCDDCGNMNPIGENNCEECWKLTIVVGSAIVLYHARGPCPPASGWPLISSDLIDDGMGGMISPVSGDPVINFGTDCP